MLQPRSLNREVIKMATMKYMVRAKIYKAKNVTFNPSTLDAHSYAWWRFVGVVEGKVVFNNYRYSVTTAKHQRMVGVLLKELGIHVDIIMPLPRGIRHDQTLAEMIQESEEHLCDKFLEKIAHKQDLYRKRKLRKLEKELLEKNQQWAAAEVRLGIVKPEAAQGE